MLQGDGKKTYYRLMAEKPTPTKSPGSELPVEMRGRDCAVLSAGFRRIFTRKLLKSRACLVPNAVVAVVSRQFPLDFQWLTFLDRH